MRVPTTFGIGYSQMRTRMPKLASRYVAHLTVGDALADAAIEALEPLSEHARESFIRAGMEQDNETLLQAPQALKNFFDAVAVVPPWFDPQDVYQGCRAFHTNSEVLSLTFVVGSGVEGFRTVIAKSFFATGRLVDFGVRRARQNLRHLTETMLPGGMERLGDGWKLTVRIRLVHAQVRRQLRSWDGWDEAADGIPISSAHVALAGAMFSARSLEYGERLGVRLSARERDSFMNIWRYVAYLLGTPEELLFRDYGEALELCRLGLGCEPKPGIESIAMANALINGIPMLGGITELEPRRAYALKLYRICRALIGNELADEFRFPRQHTFLLLPALRWRRQTARLLKPLTSRFGRSQESNYFIQTLDFLRPDEMGMSYRLPPQLYSDERIEW